MMRKSVVFVAVCLVLSVSAVAQGPQPQCSLLVSPNSGVASATVFTANVSCSDSLAPILNVSLDWGDGSPAYATAQTSFTQQHAYTASGNYMVTVMATDAVPVAPRLSVTVRAAE